MRRILVIASLLLAGCKTIEYVEVPVPAPIPPPEAPRYGETGDRLNALIEEPFDETRAVDVFYATNRDGNAGCGDDEFGVEPAQGLRFGVCRLNVPKLHEVGAIDEASSPRDDPNRYYRLLRHFPSDEAAWTESLADSAITDILVVVHGFNVRFKDAVHRAAQLAYDLKFQGPVVLYSWPAGPRSGFSLINRTYERNRANAEQSLPDASRLFDLLGRLPGKTHVLVHSMGHQVVVPSLLGLAGPSQAADPFRLARASVPARPVEVSDSLSAARPALRFGQLILNAPDIDLEVFRTSAASLTGIADRVTVYCSYNDNAIAASEAFNDGRRLGACERIDGVDVINVREIDAPALGVAGLGHGYYASRPILTDVFQVLLGIDARRRLFVRRSEPNSTEDYYLRR